jgi:predicted RNA-binding protein YlqC (UPF0109 family)
MKDLIQYIAESLVDAPEAVEVTEALEGDSPVIRLKVKKEDLGKVIGKKGRTAKAMRTLLSAATLNVEKRPTLEILE